MLGGAAAGTGGSHGSLGTYLVLGEQSPVKRDACLLFGLGEEAEGAEQPDLEREGAASRASMSTIRQPNNQVLATIQPSNRA